LATSTGESRASRHSQHTPVPLH